MRVRSCRFILLPVFAVTVMAGLALAASAGALVTHKYESTISKMPLKEPAESSELGPVTLAAEAGKLYVDDGRVGVFEAATGNVVGQESLPGVLFGDGAGEPQVYIRAQTSGGRVTGIDVFGTGTCGTLECAVLQNEWTGTATPNGSFFGEGSSALEDVTVDQSSSPTDWAKGDVFVTTRSFLGQGSNLNAVDVIKPEAGGGEKYVTQLLGTPLGGEPSTGQGERFETPVGAVVSGFNGDLLVADQKPAGTAVDVFEPVGLDEYSFVRQISTGLQAVEAMAVDAATGEVYVGGETGEVYTIDEFDVKGGLVAITDGSETPEGNFHHVTSLAVDAATHRVFVGDYRAEGTGLEGGKGIVDVFSGDRIAPDVTTGSASGIRLDQRTHTWGVTLTGTVNPDSAGEASCQFVWGTSPSFGHVVPCSRNIPDGSSEVLVEAAIEGLEPGTTYFYRLQAHNAQANNDGEGSQSFTTPGPGLREELVSEVSSTSVTLKALIAPEEHAASYRFEYDTRPYSLGETAHGSSVPSTPTFIGAGSGEVGVEQHAQQLSASTTYHYRVVVLSEYEPGKVEEFDGHDQTFVTQGPGGSLVLPDDRAWELVSPPNKHGALLLGLRKSLSPLQSTTQAAADGQAVTYTAFSPIFSATEPEAAGYSGAAQIFSQRDPSGWLTTDVSPPHSSATGAGAHAEYPLFSEDLSLGLVEFVASEDNELLSGQASEQTPYIRESSCVASTPGPGQCYLPLVSGKEGEADDVPPGTVFGGDVEFVGATTNFSRIALRSTAQLTKIATGGHEELYEWSAGRRGPQRLQLLSLLPKSEGGGPSTEKKINIGSEPERQLASGLREISADGSRVFWTTEPTTRLYMSDLLGDEKVETARLDTTLPGAAGGAPKPVFQGASADGSKVFFTDTERLTTQSSRHGSDLYECEMVTESTGLTCDLTDLTPESSGRPSEVQKLILGLSEEGSYVYFVANGVLGNAPSDVSQGSCGGGAASSVCNLYLAHDGEVRYIATLSGEDELDWGSTNSLVKNSAYVTARVSPNGRFATFMSDRSLTGYDNRDARNDKPDAEVYLYDALSGKLMCASCDPSGARPEGVEVGPIFSSGSANLAAILEPQAGYSQGSMIAANIPGATTVNLQPLESLYLSRVLSDSGRLFFNSSDGLVPQDINGQEDVYEFEPVGVSNCSGSAGGIVASEDGCIGLISSGTSSGESGFLDASASGNDVFFLTSEKLVPADRDTALDVYDARVCTESEPCRPNLVEPSVCVTADACRVASAVQPQLFSAGPSETFFGASDELPAATKRSSGKKKKEKKKKKGKKQGKRRRRSRVLHSLAKKLLGEPKKLLADKLLRKPKNNGGRVQSCCMGYRYAGVQHCCGGTRTDGARGCCGGRR